jgi:hypothetical protein
MMEAFSLVVLRLVPRKEKKNETGVPASLEVPSTRHKLVWVTERCSLAIHVSGVQRRA